MTGWNDRESAGREWAYFVHPDDRTAVRDIGRQLSEGVGNAVATYRYLCRNGSHLWVEASFVLLPAADGEPTQFVASIRDITARKLAEDRLAAASRELARQASSDGLTGIANRRRLDETLDLEWRRASRDRRPLSLLMIDVDCFKAYNDRYGHQQGDHVLRAVAAAITRSVRRPGDLVARYGGEEFAVLLADTAASGTAGLAEKVRAAVEGLGIAHADNLSAALCDGQCRHRNQPPRAPGHRGVAGDPCRRRRCRAVRRQAGRTQQVCSHRPSRRPSLGTGMTQVSRAPALMQGRLPEPQAVRLRNVVRARSSRPAWRTPGGSRASPSRRDRGDACSTSIRRHAQPRPSTARPAPQNTACAPRSATASPASSAR